MKSTLFNMFPKLPPLAKHIARFSKQDSFSPETVSAGLKEVRSHLPRVKGTIIAAFNAAHVGCPFGRAQFKPDANGEYGKHLHLGTTRVWNEKGEIDEQRWEEFKTAVAKEYNGTKIVKKSDLFKYLGICLAKDPQQTTTGRNTYSLFSSKRIQAIAASAAWNEVFDRLSAGNIENDPYLHLEKVWEFFENSEAAFQDAENGTLPVPNKLK